MSIATQPKIWDDITLTLEEQLHMAFDMLTEQGKLRAQEGIKIKNEERVVFDDNRYPKPHLSQDLLRLLKDYIWRRWNSHLIDIPFGNFIELARLVPRLIRGAIDILPPRGRPRKLTQDEQIEKRWDDVDLELFTRAYVEGALWSSTDDEGYNLDDQGFDWASLMPDSQRYIKLMCRLFFAINREDIGDNIRQAGIDFWLTQHHHGCGFWEVPDWPKDAGQRLTRSAQAFDECQLYVIQGRHFNRLVCE